MNPSKSGSRCFRTSTAAASFFLDFSLYSLAALYYFQDTAPGDRATVGTDLSTGAVPYGNPEKIKRIKDPQKNPEKIKNSC
jgi:hypothetical protein